MKGEQEVAAAAVAATDEQDGIEVGEELGNAGK